MGGQSQQWRFALQETVGANRYVQLPGEVRRAVESDHPLDGPSVVWSYERTAGYAVLSRRPLSGPDHVEVGRYKVYDADTDRARVRPPDDLDGALRARLQKGDRVVYLAYEAMIEGENPTVYLLTAGQLLDLLPASAQGRTTDDGLRQAILETPGLLPTP